MDDDSERMIYIALGPLAAMALGMLLIPVRGFTTASNFTFIFLVLTIVVAEFGGRGAAVATALTSALSLDFFLTQPYMTLEIADKHDLIAFVGLAVCGLVAAGLGAKAGRAAGRPARNAQTPRPPARGTGGVGCPRGARLPRQDTTRRLPVGVAAVGDGPARRRQPGGGHLPPIARAVPETVLRQDDPLPIHVSDRDQHPRDLPLAPEGARLALTVAEPPVGWLDVWGGKAPASAEGRRTLSDVARVLAAMLARPRESTPGARDTMPDP